MMLFCWTVRNSAYTNAKLRVSSHREAEEAPPSATPSQPQCNGTHRQTLDPWTLY
jgi:hypothetical protein